MSSSSWMCPSARLNLLSMMSIEFSFHSLYSSALEIFFMIPVCWTFFFVHLLFPWFCWIVCVLGCLAQLPYNNYLKFFIGQFVDTHFFVINYWKIILFLSVVMVPWFCKFLEILLCCLCLWRRRGLHFVFIKWLQEKNTFTNLNAS